MSALDLLVDCLKDVTKERDDAAAALEQAQAETERLQNWVNDLQAGMYINCVYCGHRYGPDNEVPATMADVLKKHISTCTEHPMSKLKKRIEQLEAGLRREKLAEGREHLTVTNEFQSDKYPWCPVGFVPLKVTDPMARDSLWDYARRRRVVDEEFTRDLEEALLFAENSEPLDYRKARGCLADPETVEDSGS